MSIELGKPADYGQFIVERRYQLALDFAGDAMQGGGFYLDVGCGNGAQTVLFAKHFKKWLGIDVEEERLKEFRHELARQHYACGDAVYDIAIYHGNHIPAGMNEVDVLTCIEVIEHTQDDAATIAELYRVLRKGGTAIITVPNKWWIFETHGAHLPFLPWNRVPFFSWLPKFIHSKYAKARIYRRSEILRLMRSAGFKIRKDMYVTAPMDMIKQPFLQRIARGWIFKDHSTSIPMLATSVMVIATKE
jgi:ubiquinone/menaquinone biosynthesis C-methylase UbiE